MYIRIHNLQIYTELAKYRVLPNFKINFKFVARSTYADRMTHIRSKVGKEYS